jgi:hypothetical protein
MQFLHRWRVLEKLNGAPGRAVAQVVLQVSHGGMSTHAHLNLKSGTG